MTVIAARGSFDSRLEAICDAQDAGYGPFAWYRDCTDEPDLSGNAANLLHCSLRRLVLPIHPSKWSKSSLGRYIAHLVEARSGIDA